jgi:hypothetical protein
MFRTLATQQQCSLPVPVNISEFIWRNKAAGIIDLMFCNVISTELSPRRRQVSFPAL